MWFRLTNGDKACGLGNAIQSERSLFRQIESQNTHRATLWLPPDFPQLSLKSHSAFLAVSPASPSPHAAHSGPETKSICWKEPWELFWKGWGAEKSGRESVWRNTFFLVSAIWKLKVDKQWRELHPISFLKPEQAHTCHNAPGSITTDPVQHAKYCQGLGLINRWPDTEQKCEANKGKGS